MAVYKRGEIYWYEFNYGRRFRGSTGCTSKREAQEVERQKRQEAARERREALGRAPLTWAVAASYWQEVGQHHRRTTGTLWSLEWLTREIGGSTRLSDINGSLIARLVAKRRADGVSNATVNRTVTQALRRVIERAKLWGEHLQPIEWRKHMLAEPRERVRELRADEEGALFAALRPDYHAIVRFALLSGCRLAECTGLRWADVDWGGRLISINGKGGKRASIPMPPVVRELLWPLQGHHPSAVFTYIVRRPSRDARRGERCLISYENMKAEWRRVKSAAALVDYRFHDNRHTAATRVLRACGNLAIVSRMLRHEKISTTAKYAHVSSGDVMHAMQQAAHGVPTKVPTLPTSETAKSTGSQ